MNQKRSNTLFIVEVAVFTALAYLLDFLANILSLKIWPQGGSISIAMVPIFIMAYRWGVKGGVLSGFLLGLLQFIMGYSQIFSLLQGFIDYFLAFTAVGLAGMFSLQVKGALADHKKGKWMTYVVLGAFVGSGLRYICHFISGVAFFGSYAPKGQSVVLYSILYNGTYMLPSFIISAIVVILVINAAPKKILNTRFGQEKGMSQKEDHIKRKTV